jgi:hypothetical protein
MKKIILVILVLTALSYGKIFDITKFSKKIATKNIDKLSKAIKKSNYTKKLPDLKLNKTSNPKVSSVVAVAKKIAEKGDFEDRLVSKTLYPASLIRQYAKYGDSYLAKMKYFSKNAVNIPLKDINKLSKYYPNMPKIKFSSIDEINDKFIIVLKQTGKKGWEVTNKIFKLSQKYPKSSIVTALYAWYLIDPQGFMEHKEELLKKIESIIKEGAKDTTRLALNGSSGIIDGFIETFKEKANILNVSLLLFLFFIFILWKLRNYIKRFFKIKIEQKLDNISRGNSKKNLESNNDDEEGTF